MLMQSRRRDDVPRHRPRSPGSVSQELCGHYRMPLPLDSPRAPTLGALLEVERHRRLHCHMSTLPLRHNTRAISPKSRWRWATGIRASSARRITRKPWRLLGITVIPHVGELSVMVCPLCITYTGHILIRRNSDFRSIARSSRSTPKFRQIRIRDCKIRRPTVYSFSDVIIKIVRRLRNRSPYKEAVSKPKFPNHLDYAWQFAGWGKWAYTKPSGSCGHLIFLLRLAYLDLGAADLEDAASRLADERNHPNLDQYRATSIAGNAVWGSVFYS
jgi:hypothetical protein